MESRFVCQRVQIVVFNSDLFLYLLCHSHQCIYLPISATNDLKFTDLFFIHNHCLSIAISIIFFNQNNKAIVYFLFHWMKEIESSPSSSFPSVFTFVLIHAFFYFHFVYCCYFTFTSPKRRSKLCFRFFGLLFLSLPVSLSLLWYVIIGLLEPLLVHYGIIFSLISITTTLHCTVSLLFSLISLASRRYIWTYSFHFCSIPSNLHQHTTNEPSVLSHGIVSSFLFLFFLVFPTKKIDSFFLLLFICILCFSLHSLSSSQLPPNEHNTPLYFDCVVVVHEVFE